jgi:threonine/homoserine/homoserine lactone efflux protein
MPHGAQLTLFLGATLVFLLTPGPAVLYIVARSVSQGRAAGLASVAGVEAGNLVHAAAAALGLSSLLVASSLAFGVVKYLGAAYLVWLGLRTLLARDAAAGRDGQPAPAAPGGWATFRQGFVVAVLNPKTALFFLAFLPQFADPHAGPLPPQLLLLGVTFVAMAFVTDAGYALLSGALSPWLARRRGLSGASRAVTGATYIGLGLLAALSPNPDASR